MRKYGNRNQGYYGRKHHVLVDKTPNSLTNPEKKAVDVKGRIGTLGLNRKAFILYRNPNPAARIFLIHRSKTIKIMGTKVTTLGHLCQLFIKKRQNSLVLEKVNLKATALQFKKRMSNSGC